MPVFRRTPTAAPLASAGRDAETAIARYAAERARPGVHVASHVFNAMEAAASAWLVDPSVQVGDLVAYLVRQADGPARRSPSLDHIAIAESHLLAALTGSGPGHDHAPTLVEAARRSAGVLADLRTVDGDHRSAASLRSRSLLAAWPSTNGCGVPVCVVISPSLTEVSELVGLDVDAEAELLLRAVADGAQRMLAADRAVAAVFDEVAADVTNPRLREALADACARLVVRVADPAGADQRPASSFHATIDGDDLTELARRGWLLPADQESHPATDGSPFGRQWWIARPAFDALTGAFAEAHVDLPRTARVDVRSSEPPATDLRSNGTSDLRAGDPRTGGGAVTDVVDKEKHHAS